MNFANYESAASVLNVCASGSTVFKFTTWPPQPSENSVLVFRVNRACCMPFLLSCVCIVDWQNGLAFTSEQPAAAEHHTYSKWLCIYCSACHAIRTHSHTHTHIRSRLILATGENLLHTHATHVWRQDDTASGTFCAFPRLPTLSSGEKFPHQLCSCVRDRVASIWRAMKFKARTTYFSRLKVQKISGKD